ncbi:MAG TPA: HIT family protein [Candidatus Limnocylindria bacterium]|jgi:diadenosine tetraphosphate (Ap4A) HIT family hydrolase
MTDGPCVLCAPERASAELLRVIVWEDDLWRLSTTVYGAVPGFSYLEPKRHIPHITDLDGPEAQTFGPVLARVTTAIRGATGADLVYVYVFGGGVAHLHVHLAPHREGDALSTAIIRGEVRYETLPNGATVMRSAEFPPRPEVEMRAAAEALSAQLSGS